MRISDWSSDVCSSDLPLAAGPPQRIELELGVLVAGADPGIADPHERLIFSKLVRGIPFCDAGFQNSFDKVRPADLRCRPSTAIGSSETVVSQNRRGAGFLQVFDTVGWVGDGADHDLLLTIERTFVQALRPHLLWPPFGVVRNTVVVLCSDNPRSG